jgi:hypothetical protein
MTRTVFAGLAGVAAAAGGAVVLGDYPLSGSVPWVAAIVIPLLVGVVMTVGAGAHQRELWVATGPLGALSMAWGVRIATGWGLDPVPAACWAAGAIALIWPPAWGLLRAGRPRAATAPSAVSPPEPVPSVPIPSVPVPSVNSQLGDLGEIGRTQVGDP